MSLAWEKDGIGWECAEFVARRLKQREGGNMALSSPTWPCQGWLLPRWSCAHWATPQGTRALAVTCETQRHLPRLWGWSQTMLLSSSGLLSTDRWARVLTDRPALEAT